MLQIKNLEVLNLAPLLIEIHTDLIEYSDYEGFRIITSAYRPKDNGVHGYFRGLDVRCHDARHGKMAEEYLNNKWTYDTLRMDKKVAIYHDVGQGLHLHLQCHYNTKRKG